MKRPSLFSFFLLAFLVLFEISSSPLYADLVYQKHAGMLDDSFTELRIFTEDTELVPEHTGEAEKTALQVYIPVNIATDSSDRLEHQRLTSIPTIQAGLTLNPKIALYFSHDSPERHTFYLAVKTDNSGVYKIIALNADIEPQVETRLETSIRDLCYNGTCTLDAYTLGDINSSQYILTFIAANDAYVVGDEIEPEDISTASGLYFNLRFSSQFEATTVPGVETLSRGDKNLTLKYNYGTVTNTFKDTLYQMVLYRYDSSTQGDALAGDTYRDIATALADDTKITFHNPEGNYLIKVSELTNGNEYTFGLAMMNRFYFVTNSSAALSQVPLELEAFLKAQGCFLLSAGLQRHHPLLTFFRDFRDQTLQRFALGRSFIHFYYSSAYDYALTVAQSPILRMIVVLLAYLMYGLIVFIKTGVLPLIFILTYLVFKVSGRRFSGGLNDEQRHVNEKGGIKK